jgi:hypothetical protein
MMGLLSSTERFWLGPETAAQPITTSVPVCRCLPRETSAKNSIQPRQSKNHCLNKHLTDAVKEKADPGINRHNVLGLLYKTIEHQPSHTEMARVADFT